MHAARSRFKLHRTPCAYSNQLVKKICLFFYYSQCSSMSEAVYAYRACLAHPGEECIKGPTPACACDDCSLWNTSCLLQSYEAEYALTGGRRNIDEKGEDSGKLEQGRKDVS